MVFHSHSESETFEFAVKFASELKGGEIILLDGFLGAGKTVFAKGLCHGLGVKREVLSPTFTVMNEYEGDRLKVCHCDAYRLSCGEEAVIRGIADYFGASDCVCVIEWAENIADALVGLSVKKVSIRYVCEDEREIEV